MIKNKLIKKDNASQKDEAKEKVKRSGIKGQMWAKVFALVLATVSTIATVFCTVCTIAFGVVDELQQMPQDLQNTVNEQLLYGYVGELYRESGISSMEEPFRWDALDGGNIQYAVTKEKLAENGSVKSKETLYTNANAVDADHCTVSQELIPYAQVQNGKRSGFWNVFLKLNGNISHNWKSVQVEQIIYDQQNGLFYAKTEAGYYLYQNFSYNNGQERGNYVLHTAEDGTLFYKNTETEKPWEKVANPEKEQGWFTFEEYVEASFVAPESFFEIVEMEQILPDEILEVSDHSWTYVDPETTYLEYVSAVEENTRYMVYMDVSNPIEKGHFLNCGVADYFPEAQQLGSFLIRFRHTSGWFLALAVLVFLASFVFLMSAAGRRPQDNEIHLCWIDRVPFGILFCAVAGLVFGCGAMDVFMVEVYVYEYISFSLALGVGILFTSIGVMFVLGLCMSTAVRVKTKNFWRYTLLYYLCLPVHWILERFKKLIHGTKEKMQGRVSMYVKALVIFLVVTIIEGIAIMSFMYDADAMFCAFSLYKFLEFIIMIDLLYQIKLIKEGGERIAAGDYSQPIDTHRMLWEIRKHAENINSVGDGISLAVEEKMKSERFKTELITNVSHDIKTPLTSIINYVDLMKKEEIDNPTVQSYIEVLDHQSSRLKKLIEDLMEASKASTGNLPVHLEICDATVMLTQVVGEFQERANKNNLELVVESPDPPVNILADGRHLWRIIDNLMSNICKYAQPGTRVYINLEQFGGMVIMTFRNISKSRLNISSEELMERFVRGDSSRNTEGNGLGLSIAQSLTSLMNGNLAIQIDGDLFKVILSFDEQPI